MMKPNPQHINFWRKAGFGVSIGHWSKLNRRLLVTGLSELRQKPTLAIFFDGVVGYLTFKVRLSREQIIGRLQRYFKHQYQLLLLEYNKLYLCFYFV